MSFLKHALIIPGAILIFFLSCDSISKKKKYPDTDMYDLSHPTVIKLPGALDEISGIAYYPQDTSVFAIIDEDGILFKIPIMHPNSIRTWQFDKKRDFEDILLKDSVFYILVSNGDIETLHFKGDSIYSQKSDFGNSKKVNEFESLYADIDSNNLILICKECADDHKSSVSTFIYSPTDSNSTYTPYNVLNTSTVTEKLGVEKMHLKASAAAVNPVTKQLYIISSVNRLLIVMNPHGDVEEVYKLDPEFYKQPEGLAFTPAGDMIVSNEFADEGVATLLIMKNKKKGK